MPSGTGFRDLACGGYHTGIQNYKTIVFELPLHCLPQLSVQVLFFVLFLQMESVPRAVAIRHDGSLVSWGSDLDDDDEPGGQVSESPAGTDFLKVGAFSYGSMALKTDGSMVVWGSDEYGKQVSAAPKKKADQLC